LLFVAASRHQPSGKQASSSIRRSHCAPAMPQ
jgi:hypothetical protein